MAFLQGKATSRCGRYYRRSDNQRIAECFAANPAPDLTDVVPDYNVAPSTFQPVIRDSRDGAVRELLLMRWGMVPFFAKSPAEYSIFIFCEYCTKSAILEAVLRPLDIVVLLKLSLCAGKRPPYLQLANELYLYPSEVYASIKRARASHLVQGPELKDRLNRSALLEFLFHGIRYAFPAERGAMTRGVPTRYAASPLKQHLEQGSEPPPVWPYAEGSVRGYSYAPLHKNVPKAALADPHLYALLALVDALRDGQARERELAVTELSKRLEGDSDGLSQP